MKEFVQTKQAEDYVQELMNGKIPLPSEASDVETEALKFVKDVSARIIALRNALRDTDSQLQALQARRSQVVRDLDSTAGEASAYAKILANEEGKRRAAKNGNGKVVELPVQGQEAPSAS